MNRCVRHLFPKPVYLFVKYAKFLIFRVPRKICRRLVKRLFRIRAPDPCKLLICQSAKTGGKHCHKRKILLFIIQNFQIVQKKTDLPCLEVSFLCPAECRNSFLIQHLRKDIRPPFEASEKNHDISVGCLSIDTGLLVQHLRIFQKLLDPGRYSPRFQLFCLQRLSLFDQQDLRIKSFLFLELRPHVQGRLLVVLHSSKRYCHDLIKQEIDRIQHFPPAAEIFVQVNSAPVPLSGRLIGCVLCHEKLRPGKPEPVDALLHIPYHKDIVLPMTDP